VPRTSHAPNDPAHAEAVLVQANGAVRVLAAASPANARAERHRLAAALARGERAIPRWEYAPPPTGLDLVARSLDAVLGHLDGATPLGALYRERAEELRIEIDMITRVGTRAFADAAQVRYGKGEDAGLVYAIELLASGRAEEPEAPREWLTDGLGPGSLVHRLREEIGRHKAPFVVRTSPGLTALAATGERHVIVAEGRRVSRDDVERTVVHEIHGHVLPRARAAREPEAIFRFGSAKGTCDQEGYALVHEERAGFLRGRRLRELALRRLAIHLAEGSAPFDTCARALVDTHGVSPEDAARLAERVYRGGTGEGPGLVRDRPYLESWLRLRTAFADPRSGPPLEDLMSRGQISLDAARALMRAGFAPKSGDSSVDSGT
jgi:hypothetical protein